MPVLSQNARWLAIYLPRLATDRLKRSGRAPGDDRPLAIYAKQANAYQLTGVDKRASELGLRLAMSLADARAIQPKLEAVEAEPEEDARALDAIAAWCERFTPIVVIDPPEGLFLDITGCAHLFGGEGALRDTIVARLYAQGFAARAAVAPTPGAGWAFARYARRQNPDLEALAALPVEALRLDAQAAALLRRLGMKTIGQLKDAPRSAFTARAGERAMLRLDQAYGRAPEALTPRRPPPPVFALRRFLEPIFTTDAILHVMQDLCGDVVEKLDMRGAGARRLELVLFGVDGRDRVISIGVSHPEREVKALIRLFREKLNVVAENIDAEFGIEAARLDIIQLAPIGETVRELVVTEEGRATPEQIGGIADILSVRLGAKRVLRPQVHELHAPERASGWRSALNEIRETQQAKPPADGVQRRPIRLFSPAQPIEALATVPDGPPIRFRWRRVLREVARAEGPERISGDWTEGAATRDYYRIEDREGRRYWLYREGLYGEDVTPRWFMHGFFA
jgi:protein ImuB